MTLYDCFTPKHHLMFHLIHRTNFQGNPTKYATWLDESLNKQLKQCCKHASMITFERVVLLKARDRFRSDLASHLAK